MSPSSGAELQVHARVHKAQVCNKTAGDGKVLRTGAAGRSECGGVQELHGAAQHRDTLTLGTHLVVSCASQEPPSVPSHFRGTTLQTRFLQKIHEQPNGLTELQKVFKHSFSPSELRKNKTKNKTKRNERTRKSLQLTRRRPQSKYRYYYKKTKTNNE